jgi:hypothetical protein
MKSLVILNEKVVEQCGQVKFTVYSPTTTTMPSLTNETIVETPIVYAEITSYSAL